MFAFRSLEALLTSGTVFRSQTSEAMDPSHYHRQIEGELIQLSTRISIILTYNMRGNEYEEILPGCRHFR